MFLRSFLNWLLVPALALPVVQSVLVWVRSLLTSMNDDVGAQFVSHVGTACLVAWSICLVGLVIVLALIVASDSSTHSED